jgi:hypothetical protein
MKEKVTFVSKNGLNKKIHILLIMYYICRLSALILKSL